MTDEMDRRMDAPMDPDRTVGAADTIERETPDSENPLTREGPNAPDAADIEDPATQR